MTLLLALFAAPVLAQPAPAPAAPASAPVASAPKVPRFTRTPVADTGCALYAPAGFTFGAPNKSEDGADVWTGETTLDGWTFGAVVVKFAAPMAGNPAELEELLVGYMAFLQGQLSVTQAAGVGRGHTHTENAAARGVIDDWVDKDGDRWAVKGWVDGRHLAVLFLYGKGEYPYFTAQQMYLDGFRFP